MKGRPDPGFTATDLCRLLREVALDTSVLVGPRRTLIVGSGSLLISCAGVQEQMKRVEFFSMLALALACSVWLSGCGNIRDQRLSRGGQLILQNITYAPITMLASPLHVPRSSGVAATISAALPTRSVSLDNGNGQCVSGNDSAGLSPGSTQYTITFTAIPGSPANCTQTVTITVDGDPIVFYLLVP